MLNAYSTYKNNAASALVGLSGQRISLPKKISDQIMAAELKLAMSPLDAEKSATHARKKLIDGFAGTKREVSGMFKKEFRKSFCTAPSTEAREMARLGLALLFLRSAIDRAAVSLDAESAPAKKPVLSPAARAQNYYANLRRKSRR
jgi:hypothetical protein